MNENEQEKKEEKGLKEVKPGEPEPKGPTDGKVTDINKKKGAETPGNDDDNLIQEAKTAVLIIIDKKGKLLMTPDVPMELEHKATLNDIEVMLIQTLESLRLQKIESVVTRIVRREIAQSAPHTADHIVNCLHKKAIEEAKANSGLVLPN